MSVVALIPNYETVCREFAETGNYKFQYPDGISGGYQGVTLRVQKDVFNDCVDVEVRSSFVSSSHYDCHADHEDTALVTLELLRFARVLEEKSKELDVCFEKRQAILKEERLVELREEQEEEKRKADLERPHTFGMAALEDLVDEYEAYLKEGEGALHARTRYIVYRPAGSYEEFEDPEGWRNRPYSLGHLGFKEKMRNSSYATIGLTFHGRLQFKIDNYVVSRKEWMKTVSKSVPLYMDLY